MTRASTPTGGAGPAATAPAGAAEPAAVTLRRTVLGRGRPAICVPVTGATLPALVAEVRAVPEADCDLLEFRMDHLLAVEDLDALRAAVAAVREALPAAVPLLATFRTAAEGGAHPLPESAYEGIVLAAIASGDVDAVDVEMAVDREAVDRLVRAAHDAHVVVVMSSHDFGATPPHDEIVRRLVEQQAMGADVVKLAAMPQDARDVLTLLAATATYRDGDAPRPAVTMAMGPLGVVSRLAGETFGSCLTFGSVGAASAPGQVPAAALRAALDLVHEAQQA